MTPLEAAQERLNRELVETRKQAGKYFAETCRLEHELAEARAQIAALQAFRDEDANTEAVYSRGVLDGWDQARAQIAAKDAENKQLRDEWQKALVEASVLRDRLQEKGTN